MQGDERLRIVSFIHCVYARADEPSENIGLRAHFCQDMLLSA